MSRRRKYNHQLMRFQWERGFFQHLKDLALAHSCREDYVRELKMRQKWGDPTVYARRTVTQALHQLQQDDSNLLGRALRLKLTASTMLYSMGLTALREQGKEVRQDPTTGEQVSVQVNVHRPRTFSEILAALSVGGRLTQDSAQLVAQAFRAEVQEEIAARVKAGKMDPFTGQVILDAAADQNVTVLSMSTQQFIEHVAAKAGAPMNPYRPPVMDGTAVVDTIEPAHPPSVEGVQAPSAPTGAVPAPAEDDPPPPPAAPAGPTHQPDPPPLKLPPGARRRRPAP